MLWQGQVIGCPDTVRKLKHHRYRLSCRQKSFSARAPDGVLVIFEVMAEGLPPDKPQDDLFNQLIQIEDERDRFAQAEILAMVASLVMVF